ncbi:hypothetical protein VNO77_03402 [Canavalia gladiata]|uniref:Uncharacterized protein n=1 Tax=Canavalia gladiata TaxID=3824 RepID=A0AAN9MUU3_CANGL
MGERGQKKFIYSLALLATPSSSRTSGRACSDDDCSPSRLHQFNSKAEEKAKPFLRNMKAQHVWKESPDNTVESFIEVQNSIPGVLFHDPPLTFETPHSSRPPLRASRNHGANRKCKVDIGTNPVDNPDKTDLESRK